ncbi:MAG: HRDC domain-containing protein [Ferrimicrobium sp.]
MRQTQALTRLINGDSVFLTGPPGAGKSYVLGEFVRHATKTGKKVAITASTGIAATQIGGMTIHSWSGLGVRDNLTRKDIDALSSKNRLERRYVTTDVLVIDEISMLSGSFLDMLDSLARAIRGADIPFGGLQLVLTGDMFQLPPINKLSPDVDFAFHSSAWRDLDPLSCYLTEQHRQSGDALSEVLQAMRDGSFNSTHLESLNARMGVEHAGEFEPTRLYSHNVDVDSINAQRLALIAGATRNYEMDLLGPSVFIEPLQRGVLAPGHLVLKVGAEVMFVANDQAQRYANGSLGRVTDLTGTWPIVKLSSTSRLVTVEPHSWILEEDGKTKAEVRQLPLRLAWAITIHKSQGMSLDTAEIDLSRAFTPGMGYVALSRLRTISGLYLRGLNAMALNMNESIFDFDADLRRRSKRLAIDTEDFAAEPSNGHDRVPTLTKTPVDQDLLERLKIWRRTRAQVEALPAYVIAHDITLDKIAMETPKTTSELLRIKGMGAARVARYGEEIIEIITAHLNPP